MNLFNRIVVILLLILLIPVLVLVIVGAALPKALIPTLTQSVAGWENLAGATQLLTIVVAGILLVLVLALLFMELRRTGPRTVRLTNIAGGEAELSTTSIEQRLTYAISDLPDVVKVRPLVLRRRNGVEVVLDLETNHQVDVPAKTDEVVGVARDVVENKIGLPLQRIKVNLRLAEPPGGRSRPQPTSSSTGTTTPTETTTS